MGFRLQLLGGAILSDGDAPIGGAVARRHPLALLALLGTARGRPLTRDKLIALLWPEADPARARHSLSNLLHVIRREVHEAAVRTAGDELRLDLEIVGCDADRFQAALEVGEAERAIGLYAGPFLDGFHLPESDEFERWAGEERDRCERAYGEALEERAEAAMDRRDWAEAVRGWDRRTRLDPTSSRAAVGLMAALVAAGDRGEALRRGEAHLEVLAAELGVGPDPAVVALLDQIRGVLPPLHPAFHPEAFRRAEAAVPSLAVVPFENLCGEGEAYLVDGLVNDLLTRLSREAGIAVLSRTTALRYRDGAKSVREIERETGARYVVEGAVQRVEGRLRVTVQLIDARSDRHLWAERYDRPAERLLDVQTEIAERIARRLADRIRPRSTPPGRKDPPGGGEARRLYHLARHHGSRRTRADVERAIELYELALSEDPHLPEAHAGLTDAWFTAHCLAIPAAAEGEGLRHALEAAGRALDLDPDLADAHAATALARWWEGDAAGAEAAFARAIELDPGLVAAHHRYAIFLAGHGRPEESLREILTALALDPLSPVLHYNVGVKYMFARDYDGAVRRFRETLQIQPGWAQAHSAIALARGLQGREAEALAAAEAAALAAPESGSVSLERAWVLATFGREREARAALAEGIERRGNPVEAGIALLALEEMEAALDWIGRGDWEVFDRMRRWDPRLDPVRTHPRFLEFVGRPAPTFAVRQGSPGAAATR
ncbi:MAG TPA: BTAD domain-containing putative transcriptional regulator [Gemmatimonadota bacterium]|nr:BTAD domain-containing putative transcriptional regulator [Gemmatimonadota bacterium]